MRIKQITLISIIALALLCTAIDADAQCAMCKAVVESNHAHGGNAAGAGLNKGILYILGIPYLLLTIAGFAIYRHMKKEQA